MGGYGSKNRRKSRVVVVTVAVVFLVGLGLLFSHLGKQKIAREEFFASAGRAVLSGDYVPMRDIVKRSDSSSPTTIGLRALCWA